MKKLIILGGILVLLGGIGIEGMAQTHNSKMDPWGFTQTARQPWTIDVHEYLKDVVSLTVRDTIFSDTLISDSIDVHLMFSAPYLISIVDTTGLGTSSDSVFVELRKQYWDSGKWASWTVFDTILPAAQTGAVFRSRVLWGTEVKPWGLQFQYIGLDTSRVKHSRICGGQ